MNKLHYIFDFDYTLANTESAILKCFHHVLQSIGKDATDDEIRYTIGLTLEQAFGVLTGESDPDRLLALRKQYVAYADTCMVAMTRFYPEAIPLMRAIRAQGGHVAVMSTKYRWRIEQSFDHEGIRDLLDDIIGGEDVSAHKPDPAGLIAIIERNGWDKADCVYVGDNVVDGEAAMRAGVDFVGVVQGTTTHEQLKAYPHMAVGDDLNAVRVACKI